HIEDDLQVRRPGDGQRLARQEGTQRGLSPTPRPPVRWAALRTDWSQSAADSHPRTGLSSSQPSMRACRFMATPSRIVSGDRRQFSSESATRACRANRASMTRDPSRTTAPVASSFEIVSYNYRPNVTAKSHAHLCDGGQTGILNAGGVHDAEWLGCKFALRLDTRVCGERRRGGVRPRSV